MSTSAFCKLRRCLALLGKASDKSVDPLAQTPEHDQYQRDAQECVKHTKGLASIGTAYKLTGYCRSEIEYYCFIIRKFHAQSIAALPTVRISTRNSEQVKVNSLNVSEHWLNHTHVS